VIASAAGCSVRALQLAFHRFRGATPMAALQRIRLEAAREEMLCVERAQSLARIAAEYGFSNPSRFAQLFRRTYGAYPSEALGINYPDKSCHCEEPRQRSNLDRGGPRRPEIASLRSQ
jgi:transcriptional regulator GlxA family with amidase domain